MSGAGVGMGLGLSATSVQVRDVFASAWRQSPCRSAYDSTFLFCSCPSLRVLHVSVIFRRRDTSNFMKVRIALCCLPALHVCCCIDAYLKVLVNQILLSSKRPFNICGVQTCEVMSMLDLGMTVVACPSHTLHLEKNTKVEFPKEKLAP